MDIAESMVRTFTRELAEKAGVSVSSVAITDGDDDWPVTGQLETAELEYARWAIDDLAANPTLLRALAAAAVAPLGTRNRSAEEFNVDPVLASGDDYMRGEIARDFYAAQLLGSPEPVIQLLEHSATAPRWVEWDDGSMAEEWLFRKSAFALYRPAAHEPASTDVDLSI